MYIYESIIMCDRCMYPEAMNVIYQMVLRSVLSGTLLNQET